MPETLLFDTDVLVDHLRGRAEARAFLTGIAGAFFISAITVAELYAGVREGEEREVLERFLQVFEVVPVNTAVAERGGLIRRAYGKSHGTGLADALIAATAEHRQAKLVTLNQKHFPMLDEVVVPYQKR